MNLRRFATLFQRDLRDAIRDGRILVAIALPVGLAIFYGVTASDDGATASMPGFSAILTVLSVVMLAAFIALLVVPVLFVEEVELGTLEALQLVARTPEIIAAKLAVGLAYSALALVVTIAVIDVHVTSWVGFVASSLLLSVSLAGFGLVFGLWLGDSGRVNTWSGVVLLPLIAPPFLVYGDTIPEPWQTLVALTPSGAGSLLLTEAIDPSLSAEVAQSTAALACWSVVGFALLWRMLDRRES